MSRVLVSILVTVGLMVGQPLVPPSTSAPVVEPAAGAANPTRTEWPGSAEVETIPLDAGEPIPLQRVSSLQLEPVHQRLLIRGAGPSDPVVTADSTGRITGQLPGVRGATEILLDNTGDGFYISQFARGRILQVDRRSLEITRVFELPQRTCPARLGSASGLLWFTYCDCQDGSYAELIGALSPSDGRVHLQVDVTGPVDAPGWPLGFYPELASSSARPGEMTVASSLDLVYRVAAHARPTPHLEILHRRGVFATIQHVYDPDGNSVLLGSHNGGHQLRLDADTLEETGRYLTGDRPTTMALRADGTLAAGNEGQLVPDIFLFAPTRRTAYRIYDFGENRPGSYQYLAEKGLAIGEEAVYAVKVGSRDSDPRLLTLDARRPTTPTVEVPTGVHRSGDNLRVRVSVATRRGGELVRLRLRERGPGGDTVNLRRRTGPGGVVTVHRSFVRSTDVGVRVQGSESAAPGAARTSVLVRPVIRSRYLNGRKERGRTTLDPSRRPLLAANIQAPPDVDCVRVSARFVHPQDRRHRDLPTKCVSVDPGGRVRALLPLPRVEGARIYQARIRVPATAGLEAATGVWVTARFRR